MVTLERVVRTMRSLSGADTRLCGVLAAPSATAVPRRRPKTKIAAAVARRIAFTLTRPLYKSPFRMDTGRAEGLPFFGTDDLYLQARRFESTPNEPPRTARS